VEANAICGEGGKKNRHTHTARKDILKAKKLRNPDCNLLVSMQKTVQIQRWPSTERGGGELANSKYRKEGMEPSS